MSEETIEVKNNVHLLVLIHGMWGHPCHLDELCRIMKETRTPTPKDSNTELRLLVAETNKSDFSYDGIDNCAERVAEEVSDLPSLQNLSH